MNNNTYKHVHLVLATSVMGMLGTNQVRRHYEVYTDVILFLLVVLIFNNILK